MPPLGDGWSVTSDSGNATDNSDASPTQAVTAPDTVKMNSANRSLFTDIMTMISIFCSRIRTPPLRLWVICEAGIRRVKTLTEVVTNWAG